jgi:hypothetical protein
VHVPRLGPPVRRFLLGFRLAPLASGLTVRHLSLEQGIEGSNPSSPAKSPKLVAGRIHTDPAVDVPTVPKGELPSTFGIVPPGGDRTMIQSENP